MIDAKIRTLLAVAGSGSYTRAAEQLCLTQPAVSHHIHQLEEEYGIKIFFRDKKASCDRRGGSADQIRPPRSRYFQHGEAGD